MKVLLLLSAILLPLSVHAECRIVIGSAGTVGMVNNSVGLTTGGELRVGGPNPMPFSVAVSGNCAGVWIETMPDKPVSVAK